MRKLPCLADFIALDNAVISWVRKPQNRTMRVASRCSLGHYHPCCPPGARSLVLMVSAAPGGLGAAAVHG